MRRGVQGGSLELAAGLTMTFNNPDGSADGRITRAELEGTQVEDLITVDLDLDTVGLDVDTHLIADLPVVAELGPFSTASFPVQPEIEIRIFGDDVF